MIAGVAAADLHKAPRMRSRLLMTPPEKFTHTGTVIRSRA